MNKPLVSVIIPVHNTEDYLDRTLNSVTGQSLRDVEIICVDDCSSDRSHDILQNWMLRDSRIRVISFEQNQGVAAARNAGFNHSLGEYIYFLDSDDWIDPNYLEVMYDKALSTEQNVVVNANFVNEFEDTSRNATSGDFGFFHVDGYYPVAQVQTFFPPVIWARLYKKEYLSCLGLRFPSLKCGEDIYYSGLAELMQEKSYVFRGPFHHYWQREGSLMHQKNNGYYYLQSFKLLYDELIQRGVPTEELRLFYAGPMILDTQEMFDSVRAFLLEIEPQVRRHPQLYVAHDLYLIEAVCRSLDYSDFLSNHNPNITLGFIRRRIQAAQRV